MNTNIGMKVLQCLFHCEQDILRDFQIRSETATYCLLMLSSCKTSGAVEEFGVHNDHVLNSIVSRGDSIAYWSMTYWKKLNTGSMAGKLCAATQAYVVIFATFSIWKWIVETNACKPPVREEINIRGLQQLSAVTFWINNKTSRTECIWYHT